MKHLLKVYWQLCLLNAKYSLTYRADLFNSIFSSMMWGFFSIIAILLLSSKVILIGGWDQGGMLLLGACYGIVVGICHITCMRGFAFLPRIMNRGELDGFLLKPVDAWFLLTLSHTNIANVVRFVFSIFLAGYLLQSYHMTFSVVSILGFIGCSLLGACAVYSILSLAGIVLIWYPNLSNLIDFVTTSIGTARYPREVLKNSPFAIALFFLPFLLAVNVPVKVLILRAGRMEVLIFILLSVGLFAAFRVCWKFAIRFYTGASA